MTTIAERGEFPHVLVVEDNQGDATLLKLAFKRAGLPGKITIAETGEIGLDILRGDSEQSPSHPDIVLLDLNLPKMHGMAFLKAVKTDPQTAPIPVIILSSSSAETEIADASPCVRAVGATNWPRGAFFSPHYKPHSSRCMAF